VPSNGDAGAIFLMTAMESRPGLKPGRLFCILQAEKGEPRRAGPGWNRICYVGYRTDRKGTFSYPFIMGA